MDSVYTFGPGGQVPSASLNTIQANAAGLAQLRGLMVGGDGVVVTTTTATVDEIACLVLGGAASSVSPGALTLSGLAASTWHYLYARIVSGVITLVVSTTAPATSPVGGGVTFMSGDPTRRYLACFRTDASGVPIPIRKSGRSYVYEHMDASNRVLSGGAATTNTTLSGLAAVVPPHAKSYGARMNLTTLSSQAGEVQCTINDEHYAKNPPIAQNRIAFATVEVPTGSGFGAHYYRLSVASGAIDSTVTIHVPGFRE